MKRGPHENRKSRSRRYSSGSSDATLAFGVLLGFEMLAAWGEVDEVTVGEVEGSDPRLGSVWSCRNTGHARYRGRRHSREVGVAWAEARLTL